MFETAQEIRDFVTAGKATFTVESAKTGAHLTYRVRKIEGKDLYFVSVLSGPNNEADYSYLGLLDPVTGLHLTRRSTAGEHATSVRGFRYVWGNAAADQMPRNARIHHEGRCGRCGRTLTVPESVESGYGPECIQHVGGR
jgi:hypothetical protein